MYAEHITMYVVQKKLFFKSFLQGLASELEERFKEKIPRC